MPFLYILIGVVGVVVYGQWRRRRQLREIEGGPATVQLPGAPITLPCPTDDELARFASEEGAFITVVETRTEVPPSVPISTPFASDRFAYFIRSECSWAYYRDRIGETLVAQFGPEPFDDFYFWKYGPGWADEVRAGRVPVAIR